MRGRLWWLWFVQTAAGGVCLAFSYETSNLANSTATMVIFSYLMQAACGATYGVVPFISKRSLGTVSGFVGAGGNTIAAIMQYIFFTNSQMTTPEAIQKLGITIMGFTTLVAGCHFPMWGSMFFPPRQTTLAAAGVMTPEEAYYTSEVRACVLLRRSAAACADAPTACRAPQYTVEEKEQGKDMPAKLFAANTLTERSKHGSSAALSALDAPQTPA